MRDFTALSDGLCWAYLDSRQAIVCCHSGLIFAGEILCIRILLQRLNSRKGSDSLLKARRNASVFKTQLSKQAKGVKSQFSSFVIVGLVY